MTEPARIDDARARREAAIQATAALAQSLAQPDPIPEQYRITRPGVYDMPADVYHRDPVAGGSLSSTGARRLAEQGGPAKFRYAADHPGEDRTEALDFGVLAHQVILGDADDRIVVINADEWRTDAIKAEVARARAAGKVPVKPKQWATVKAMAEAIENHPKAAGLLHSAGKAEQTLVWRDSSSGVWCRARFDYYRAKIAGLRLVIPDLKTTEDASNEAFAKSAAKYGYHQQADFYCRGPRALGLDSDPLFVCVAIEKKPPYLVNLIEFEDADLAIGRNLNQAALHTFADCRRTGQWPGYGGPEGDVQLVGLPSYYRHLHDED